VNTQHDTLEFNLELEHSLSLDFEDDEGVIITTYVALYPDDFAQEVDTPLGTILEETLSLCKFDSDYKRLYCVAHELQRHAEKLREVAQQIEDGNMIQDLFNVDPNDLPEVYV